jgi:galactose-1-phosphate uridylyltransferase
MTNKKKTMQNETTTKTRLLYRTNDYEIQNQDRNQDQNQKQIQTFFLHWKYPNKSLALSLTKTGILAGGTITDDYQTIQFRAFSVTPLFSREKTTTPEKAQLFFYHVSKQMDYLITKEHLIYQKTDANLTWVNCEMGSFIMMMSNLMNY